MNFEADTVVAQRVIHKVCTHWQGRGRGKTMPSKEGCIKFYSINQQPVREGVKKIPNFAYIL